MDLTKRQREQLAWAVMTLVVFAISVALGVNYPTPPPPSDDLTALGTTNFDAIEAADLTLTDDFTVADDVSVGGDLTVNSRYPLLAASDLAVYCGQATVTGKLTVTLATHGVTTPTAVLESMASAPAATAGDPFMPYSIWSGSMVTLTVAQDDGTEATKVATVDYCIIGQD